MVGERGVPGGPARRLVGDAGRSIDNAGRRLPRLRGMAGVVLSADAVKAAARASRSADMEWMSRRPGGGCVRPAARTALRRLHAVPERLPHPGFPVTGVVDAGCCIAYQSIENRDVVPEPLRQGFGGRLFGCDVCQEVCPCNQRARPLCP